MRPRAHCSGEAKAERWQEDDFRTLAALGASSEETLLAKANPRGAACNWQLAALSASLLRSMRLLDVTDRGPRCVAELPFNEVDRAVRCAADWRKRAGVGDDRALLDWRTRHGIDVWAADRIPWRRRLVTARRLLQARPVPYASARCHGLEVAAARVCEIPLGPMEGAEGLELIFADGSVVVLDIQVPAPPGVFIGSRVSMVSEGGAHWLLEASLRAPRRLMLDRRVPVVMQPSPTEVSAEPGVLAR